MISALPLLLLAAGPQATLSDQQRRGTRAVVTASAQIIRAERIGFNAKEKPDAQNAPRKHSDRQIRRQDGDNITEFY